ncbi:hypothetical protein, partial [Glutamicibacter soli]
QQPGIPGEMGVAQVHNCQLIHFSPLPPYCFPSIAAAAADIRVNSTSTTYEEARNARILV